MREAIEKILQEPEAAKILYRTFQRLLGLASNWDSLDEDDVINLLHDETISSYVD